MTRSGPACHIGTGNRGRRWSLGNRMATAPAGRQAADPDGQWRCFGGEGVSTVAAGNNRRGGNRLGTHADAKGRTRATTPAFPPGNDMLDSSAWVNVQGVTDDAEARQTTCPDCLGDGFSKEPGAGALDKCPTCHGKGSIPPEPLPPLE